MPRDSIGRMVARAARTGGRRPGSQRSIETFHIVILVIVVLGALLVWFSRYELEQGTVANSTPPTTKDTWLTALSFDVCGTQLPALPANPNASTGSPSEPKAASSSTTKLGLYTVGDGLVHIHPLGRVDAGDNATLGRFIQLYPGLAISQTALHVPGQPPKKNGDRCGSSPGTVQVKVWTDSLPGTKGVVLSGNPGDLRLGNDQLITVAFVRAGASIPRPPQSVISAMLSGSSTSTTTTAALTHVPTTLAPPGTVPRSSHLPVPTTHPGTVTTKAKQ